MQDGILQGFIDRLVILDEGGRVVGVEVLDYKTDQLDWSDPGVWRPRWHTTGPRSMPTEQP